MDLQKNNNFPLEIRDLEPKRAEMLTKYLTGEHTGFVQVGPKRYLMPSQYRQEASNMYNMEIRPTDIFVASYPRSGTTWTQQLVWMVANDLDYATSDAIPLDKRYAFLDFYISLYPTKKKHFSEGNISSESKTLPATEQLAELPSPRFIKTHLPLSFLPPSLVDTAKMVYVARDPRDVAVSFYHMKKFVRTEGNIGDFKMYWDFFIKDLHYLTPFFEHLKESWEKRHHPNMLFLFYEELSTDLAASIRRVADFFGKQLTDDEISQLCKHLSIKNFKNNNKSFIPGVYNELGITLDTWSFIGKGKAGGWRDYFDEEMSQQAERWIAENLRDTDFRFSHLE